MNPRIKGAQINVKSQIKQEIVLDYQSFNFTPQVIQITFTTEENPTMTRLSVPLPFTLNKYMVWRSYDITGYKQNWKRAKPNMVKIGYRNINAKFIKSPSDLNRFFDSSLVDVTPTLNPKRKTKYGSSFLLPDGQEYFIRLHLDSQRIKIMAAPTGNANKSRAEWAV
mmetsp:Transcript_33291/g.30235  ORF Transcript_33291/g.30235 Transcript_33291/m.30235 type:complete len:167 (+) Transcript_33291:4832-5332(+)